MPVQVDEGGAAVLKRLIGQLGITVHVATMTELPTEVLLASAVGAFWVYHRGAHYIRRPLADITRHRDGIPFLAPEVALLFKSRSNGDKDRHDIETALPALNAEQRSWLQDTLEHMPPGQTAHLPRR